MFNPIIKKKKFSTLENSRVEKHPISFLFSFRHHAFLLTTSCVYSVHMFYFQIASEETFISLMALMYFSFSEEVNINTYLEIYRKVHISNLSIYKLGNG